MIVKIHKKKPLKCYCNWLKLYESILFDKCVRVRCTLVLYTTKISLVLQKRKKIVAGKSVQKKSG